MSTCKGGLIVQTYPSIVPQAAELVTYDVWVSDGDGGGVLYKNVSPSVQRTNVDILPARPGQMCIVFFVTGDTPLFYIVEPPYFDDCPEP